MPKGDLYVAEVEKKEDLVSFVKLPWLLYKGDRYWIPPLIKDQISKLSPSHPFFSHAEKALFLARRNGEIAGRIAAIIDRNYIDYQGEKLGFFGFFESVRDDEVARALFSTARDWLRSRGMTKMAGPFNPSSNDECGLLVDGFDSFPSLMMPYNPPYYPSMFEGYGLKKAMDLFAYHLDKSSFAAERLFRIIDRVLKKEPDLRIRTLDIHRLQDELKIVKAIYDDAWSRNWGFVPMTEEEMGYLAKTLRPIVVPDLVLFVYWKTDPVGFSVALPDYNQVLKHLGGKLGVLGMLKFLYYSRRITSVRIMLLGVRKAFQKKGIEGLLYAETFRRGVANGYRSAECSWILESNLLMQRGLEHLGAKRTKTYRIYEMPI